jgi:hypothetical protein
MIAPDRASPRFLSGGRPRTRGWFRRWSTRKRRRYRRLAAIGAILLLGAFWTENQFSWLDSTLFVPLARQQTFSLRAGACTTLARPASGPYDQRLGLAQLRQFIPRLQKNGYVVKEQARDSLTTRTVSRLGLFPTYEEKTQAGLEILDAHGRPVYRASTPRETYQTFEAVPPLIVATVLFIENRQMLDTSDRVVPHIPGDGARPPVVLSCS